MFLLVGGIAAEAAEIKVLSAGGIRQVMEDLGPKFERATGHKLAIAFARSDAVVKRIQGGETADSITYGDPAQGVASGIHFAKVLDRLGIANEMKPKTVFLPKSGPVGVLVANGEAEIGVHQFQQLIPVAGIEIVGPLPADLQNTVIFAAAIMNGTENAEASKRLVAFLRTPGAAVVIKAKGLEPATP